MHVDNAVSNSVDEITSLRFDPDEKAKLDEQDSLVLNSTLTSPETIKGKPTKTYIDSFSGNGRNRRDLATVFKIEKMNLIKLT